MEKVKELISTAIIASAVLTVPYLISFGWYSGKKHAQR